MAKPSFVYRGSKRTVESVVRKSKQAGGLYDSYLASEVQMYKAKEGEACVRILPPTWDDLEKWGDGWEVGIYLHYNVGPDNAAYLCSDKMNGEPCPVCEARRATSDPDEMDQLKPSYRCLAWVIDRDNEKAGPMIWSMPASLFRDINARSVDKKSNTPILIDDPEEGYDLVFNREGTDLRTKYTGVEVMREPSPLHDDEKLQNRWLNYISEHPLPEILHFFDAEHIEKVLFGKAGSKKRGDAGEVEEETPAPRSRRGGRAVEEEVEEEAAPRSARRTSRVVEEEVEEEPAPRATRTSRRAAAEEEVEEEPPFEDSKEKPVSRRRALLDAEEEETPAEEPEDKPRGRRAAAAEEEEEATPTQQARRSLERLKPRGRR